MMLACGGGSFQHLASGSQLLLNCFIVRVCAPLEGFNDS